MVEQQGYGNESESQKWLTLLRTHFAIDMSNKMIRAAVADLLALRDLVAALGHISVKGVY